MSIERNAIALAASDWIGPAPDPVDDWNHLTLGEQQRYCTEVCRTKGAVYSTSISPSEITIKVALPDGLKLTGLTRDEAGKHERYLHRKVEDAIVWILRYREQSQ